jgi:hypothetical protein
VLSGPLSLAAQAGVVEVVGETELLPLRVVTVVNPVGVVEAGEGHRTAQATLPVEQAEREGMANAS